MTGALFDVPDLHDAEAEWLVWGYGIGAESTAGLVRTLEEPEFRPAELCEDLSNLVVLIAQTGDEWSSLIALADTGNPGYHDMLSSIGSVAAACTAVNEPGGPASVGAPLWGEASTSCAMARAGTPTRNAQGQPRVFHTSGAWWIQLP